MIAPGILALSLMGFYLSSMAPGLTWANYGSDGGDLIAAAATGGIAHPSGYPLYLLLARLFQFLPVGSLAFRTHLLSAIATTLAAVILFELIARSLPLPGGISNWMAGLAGAYSFGLAPLVWSQAIITEVYGLHILFIVVILALSVGLLPSFLTPRRLDCFLGLAFGLGLGNHVTIVLLLPLLFSALPERQTRVASLLGRIAWMSVGLLIYLTLPLRALQNPPINWGNPVTPEGFLWLVTGESYRTHFLTFTAVPVWERVRTFAGLLLDQAGLPGLVLAVAGLVFFYKPSALYRNVIWILLAFSTFALVYGASDSVVYLMPVCLGFSIWIGVGLAGITASLSRGPACLANLALILFLLLLAGTHWHLVDASHDLRAETFGREVLDRAPREAIIFTSDDKALFTLWYFHFALQERTDLAIVSTELLQFDWYQQSLHSTYPDLQLPGLFPFAETMAVQNPERPVCFIEYIEEAKIRCRPGQAP